MFVVRVDVYSSEFFQMGTVQFILGQCLVFSGGSRMVFFPNAQSRCPLLVATSGGAGCNVAIEAIADTLIAEGAEHLPTHTSVLLNEKKTDLRGASLWITSCIMNARFLGPAASAVANLAHYPTLPDREALLSEMKQVNEGQMTPSGTPKHRRYVDMLLDVFDSGYLYVAIQNLLAKRFNIKQARNLVDQQGYFEKSHFNTVKDFFLKKLEEAEKESTPYTEIITTQMISLDAICAAVLEYNKTRSLDKHVVVHQYMSDVFTEDAQHYVPSLCRLGPKARSVLHLHGMNITDSKNTITNIKKYPFASIEEIPHQENPMIRSEFKDKERLAQFKPHSKETQHLPIQQDKDNDRVIEINAGEKVAAIMLSSLGGDNTVDYTEKLTQLYSPQGQGLYDKVFVFCGRNDVLKEKIKKVIQRAQGRAACLGLLRSPEIIILDQQDAAHVAGILTRSDLTILRGGMVLMEEMALDHDAKQRFFFPHEEDDRGQFTTGLPWEDGSINYFIRYLKDQYGVDGANKGTVEHLHRVLTNAETTSQVSFLLEEIKNYRIKLDSGCELLPIELSYALNELLEQLQKDLHDKRNKGLSDKAICSQISYKLALETLGYINHFSYIRDQFARGQMTDAVAKQEILQLTKGYDERCYKLAHISNFTKAIIYVLAAAVGCTVGLLVGGLAGVMLGMWVGPGAVVTALSSLLSAGATSGSVALGFAATSTSFTAVRATQYSFFKPTPIELAMKNMVTTARDTPFKSQHSIEGFDDDGFRLQGCLQA